MGAGPDETITSDDSLSKPEPKLRRMPYSEVQYRHIADPFIREEVFRRADWLLRDAYGMFALPPPALPDAGGGNWAIALVLLCVMDGISYHVYPTRANSPKQEQRFKLLFNEKLYWGPVSKGWYRKQDAGAVLYTEFRNPLVHELAADKPARARPSTYLESAVGKWGPVTMRDIEAIDSMRTWSDDWPTLATTEHNGGRRLELSCAALYWSVKHMANSLAADANVIASAVASRAGAKRQTSIGGWWSALWSRLRG